MASYHIRITNGSKGYGKAHAEYICREGKYKNRDDEELIMTEHINMPDWAKDNPVDFWEQADLNERENGRSYKGIVIALPNELTQEEQINLTNSFVKNEIGEDFVCTFAIHTKKADLENDTEQPHAHIMMSERKLDDIERTPEQFFKRANSKNPELGGTKKDRSWNEVGKVRRLRKSWEEIQNKYLEKNKVNARVDCRKLSEIKQEAIDNGNVAKAKLYDREPRKRVSQKTIRKLSTNQALTDFEELEIQSLLVTMEIKKRLEKEYADLTKEYQKIEKPNLEQTVKYEYDAKEILRQMQKIKSEINTESYNMKLRIADLERRVKALDRIAEPQRIEKIAINKLSNNQEKTLEKEYVLLSQKRINLEKKSWKLQENMPNRFNFFAHQAAKEELKKVDDYVLILKQKENKNRDEYDNLIAKFSIGELKNQKEKIKRNILDNNKKTREKITKIISTSNAIIKENENINSNLDLTLPLAFKLKKKIPRFLDGKNKLELKEPLSKNNIANAVAKISQDEVKSKNVSWNINLKRDWEDLER